MKIKFKVYDRLESKWILPNVSSGERFKISANGDLLDPSGSPTDHLFEYCLSTGIKDIAGEDIYEYDIVRSEYSKLLDGSVISYFSTEAVSWDSDNSCWVLVDKSGNFASLLPICKYQIIGNYIENPTLLN